MALQENKAEPKAKDSVEAAPSPKGVEKSEPKAKGSDKTGSGTNTPDKALPELKGVQPESNDTGQIPAAGSKAGGPKGSVQNPGQTNSTHSPEKHCCPVSLCKEGETNTTQTCNQSTANIYFFCIYPVCNTYKKHHRNHVGPVINATNPTCVNTIEMPFSEEKRKH